MNNLKKYIKEVIKELIDEESTSGDAGAFLTPNAFKPSRKIEEAILKTIQTELLNEVTYGRFKKEVSHRTKTEQIHKAIREVKRKIQEIDRIVEYTSRMKQELSEGEGLKYWKTTERNIHQIGEMLENLNNKFKNLN